MKAGIPAQNPLQRSYISKIRCSEAQILSLLNQHGGIGTDALLPTGEA